MKFPLFSFAGLLIPGILLLFVGSGAWERLAAADASSPKMSALQDGHLNVVCSTSLFHGIDRAELLSSSKVWLHSVAGHVGWAVNPQVELIDTVEIMRKRIDEGSIDVVVSSTLEYLAIARPGVLLPVMTMAAGSEGKGKIKYLLLVNRDSGLAQIEDLKGKSLAVYSRFDANLSRMWIDVMLQEQRLGPAERFFGSFTSTPKPSSACLPLFFGKADACLIDNASWDVLRELNPQVGGKLKAIAESPEMVESLFSVHVNQKDHQADIRRGMSELQNNPEGRQILLFFRSRRTVPIDKQDLDSVIDLQSKYLKIAGITAAKVH